MSSVWQKIKSASGSGTQQTVTFVSQVFSRRNYKDLDKDIDDDVFGNETLPQASKSSNVKEDPEGQLDAGVEQRRKYVLISDNTTTVLPTNTDNLEHSEDVISCENSQNEIKELGIKYNVISHPSASNIPPTIETDNSDLKTATVGHIRHRRDSYDKALSEMRESYDRVFTDIVDYSENTPAILPLDYASHNRTEVDVTCPDLVQQSDIVKQSNANAGPDGTTPAQSSPKPPLHRQISSVLQNDIPAAINVIRNRNYSKLDDEIIEIEDTRKTEWSESFPVAAKAKSKGRKRSKKVWKKTKKAARVTFKWIRRSFVSLGSSYNYGIPITVAMYGGSNRTRRTRGYEYR